MKSSIRILKDLSRPLSPFNSHPFRRFPRNSTCVNCRSSTIQRRQVHQPADRADFVSIVDNPPKLVRTGQQHSWGVLVLAVIPITAFALGTWQIQRLDWKTKLIARYEDRLVRDPLPLPPRVDPDAIAEFDYRRVYTTGRFRHDKEMLIGPRTRDGNDGYLVTTPLERGDADATVLVNRGWISKDKVRQMDRPESLPKGEVAVEGLLREPFKRNMFSPVNNPEDGEYHFPDVAEMAKVAGSQPVWIEEIMDPDLLKALDREAKGIPIGRPAEVNLRNNHTQYIFTWYSLCLATSVMLWMIVRKKPNEATRRVRMNKNW